MSEDSSLLTRRGIVIIRRLVLAASVLAMIAAGLWMLNQVLDSVVAFGRDFVDVPFYPTHVSVWFYHDAAYALLWVAYAGIVFWELSPWRGGWFGIGKLVAALLGFALLTAGLWISQDLMNAVLILHRSYVDLPFSVAATDPYQTRDIVTLLVFFAFVSFYALARVIKKE